MPAIDEQINSQFDQLKSLLDQVQPLRARAAELETQLNLAQRDYARVLDPLNSEAVRLNGRKVALKAALREVPQAKPQPAEEKPDWTPPPGVIDFNASNPPPPPESPRTARKRLLWERLYYFLDENQLDPDPEKVKSVQALAGMVKDESRDIGDMLEVLAWGEIWKKRADWETPEEQASWLTGWCEALELRLKFWTQFLARLQADSRQGLLKEKQKGSPEDWQAYLQSLAEEQRIENKRLAQEVAVLEESWRAKQAGGQGSPEERAGG